MVEEKAYCIDVIRQIQAMQAALNKVSSSILEHHLNSCVTTAVQGDDPKERERVLKEIIDVFETATKVDLYRTSLEVLMEQTENREILFR